MTITKYILIIRCIVSDSPSSATNDQKVEVPLQKKEAEKETLKFNKENSNMNKEKLQSEVEALNVGNQQVKINSANLRGENEQIKNRMCIRK